ncbi:MAG TPA: D-alanyl-D-alanine carboxypeptidase/D-alanyl-D-alanine-endopeptidase [Casimicrobiaceae bacterium]|jgi:D-alanyl-D-alanine carboxypeptidase/D-alanyl-D-alanine-endopeptidase (penicillin-binding protein 4)
MTMLAVRVALLVATLLIASTSLARDALPRAVGRAFLDHGVPLNRVAIIVQEIGKSKPIFAYDAERPMNPASVMKLVTTFAALEILGRDHRWKTEAYLGGPILNRVLKGDLILKGYGDPKITIEQWQAFMAALRMNGLDAIEGDLVLDRSYFSLPLHDPASFDGEPLKPYNVGPDALLVNFKSVRLMFAPDVVAGTVSVNAEPRLDGIVLGPSPALDSSDCGDWRNAVRANFFTAADRASVAFAGRYALSCGERDWWIALLDHPHYVHAVFTAAFREAGGRFSGGLKERRAPRDAQPFATLESPPLYDIVRDVNKLSNNVMARQIFLTLAAATYPPPATPAKAADAVKSWLKSRKLTIPGLTLENGSGLSRHERITAGGLARLLLAADASPIRDEFASSLAVAATDGTVERRFQNGTVAGQALLKTGSLEGVRALAGYVIDGDGRRFVVVAIINHKNAAGGAGALDKLVQWVYQNGAAWNPALQH